MFEPVGSAEACDAVVLQKVCQAFADALGVGVDDVSFGSSVMGDLGAESLDLLDIAFRLERAFDVRIPRGGIEQTGRQGLGVAEAYEVGGVLTLAALGRLADAMPEVPRAEFRDGLKVSEVGTLLRVGTFYNIVQGLRAPKAAG
ncbi:MAG: acyl carrier protein [Myxococcales bacterium]|nr:acyl carrier protein [Myxococcales bacterium]